MDDDRDIRAEAEDVAAPAGRCRICRRPFGMRSEDGFYTFRFDSSDDCTQCVEDEKFWASRRYDDEHRRRRE